MQHGELGSRDTRDFEWRAFKIHLQARIYYACRLQKGKFSFLHHFFWNQSFQNSLIHTKRNHQVTKKGKKKKRKWCNAVFTPGPLPCAYVGDTGVNGVSVLGLLGT